MQFVVNTGSQTDCYVKLWLPTASCWEAQTRTVHNCRNPVWNETFHFMIQSEVKVGSETVSRCFLKGASSPAVGRLFLRGLRITPILNSVNLTERFKFKLRSLWNIWNNVECFFVSQNSCKKLVKHLCLELIEIVSSQSESDTKSKRDQFLVVYWCCIFSCL